MKGATANLSWKPISNGGVFCAPACGHGCTRKEFERATAQAELLVRKLGDGWKPNVWENLGWHWSVVKDGLKIHPSSDCQHCGMGHRSEDHYVAYLGKGDTGGKWVEHGKTPGEAIRNVIRCAIEEVESLVAIVGKWAADGSVAN